MHSQLFVLRWKNKNLKRNVWSRFRISTCSLTGTVIVEPAPRAEMANILSSGGFKKRDCMKVIRIYEKILKYLEKYDPELTARISMRACRECLVNLRCGFDWAQAVEQSFIGQIYAASPAVAGDIRTTLKPLLA